jgi:hypothetical protein
VTDRRSEPILVRQYDGRLEPLDSNRICLQLFAATDALGKPDTILARDLADTICELVAAECGSPISAQDLVYFVAKYVRESGHPAIARTYAVRSRLPDKHPLVLNSPRLLQIVDPSMPARDIRRKLFDPALREAAMDEVYPRDVTSLVRDGMILLCGLEHPFELAASVLSDRLDYSSPDLAVNAAIMAAESHAGGLLVMDGPEYALMARPGEPVSVSYDFLKSWCHNLSASDIAGEIHLNQSASPAWASDPQTGPLFQSLGAPGDAKRIGEIAFSIAMPGVHADQSAVSWHVPNADLTSESPTRLMALLDSGDGNQSIQFVFDRPTEPISLGAGLTRDRSSALLYVGVHLARLAEQLSPSAPEIFLQKLANLVRIAVAAGQAKFNFLRRHGRPELHRGFMLERARLVVVPVGLEEAVRFVTDRPACDLGPGSEFARQIVVQLMQSLAQETPGNLDAVVESLPSHFGFGFESEIPNSRDAAGLTVWDGDAPVEHQLQASGGLHKMVGGGTAAVLLPRKTLRAGDRLQFLRFAAHHGIRRLRFVSQV